MPSSTSHLTALIAACVVFGTVGCGGGGGGTTAALHVLRFEAQPDSGLAGRPFAPIRVRLVDAAGRPVEEDLQVRLTLADPKGTELRGTVVRDAPAGAAEFDDVVLIGGARGLVLEAHAEAPGVAPARSAPFDRDVSDGPRHVIVMIADGWGYKHIEATRSFSGMPAPYAGFASFAMTTWDTNVQLVNGTGYDPAKAWSEFFWLYGAADSASTATAMCTGSKTNSGRIAIGPGVGGVRLQSIGELARANGLGSGVVTSVPVSHATPAAWGSHNDSRGNYTTIADEYLFGDPAATSTGAGGHGPTPDLMQVVIGGGHPALTLGAFVSAEQLSKARLESGNPGGWTVVDRLAGGGVPTMTPVERLLAAARDPGTARLLGLFGGPGGNLPFQLHDKSGLDPVEPTLAHMSKAALAVLGRNPKGFYLMIEGGAVDWASHANQMSPMIGEMLGFDDAVAAVVAWIEDPTNGSHWGNTLLIVTGDHECGLLTAGPGVFPDKPLGDVTPERIDAEKVELNNGARASWDDLNGNDAIDAGETIHWTWNSPGHSNCLIPCFFKGMGSEGFASRATGADPVRGRYIDNTDVFRVMFDVLAR